MKKTFAIILSLAAVAISANAQGYFNFANGGVGVSAPINETDGTTKLAGSAYKADYYWAAGTVATQSAFDAAVAAGGSNGGIGQANAGTTTPTSFSANGFFLGGTQTINGGSGTVTLQVKAWRASDGASYAIASGVNGAHAAQGNLIQVALGTGGSPVPNMVGLQSFNLQVVGPEPATIALGLMGAGALFIRRRKV